MICVYRYIRKWKWLRLKFLYYKQIWYTDGNKWITVGQIPKVTYKDYLNKEYVSEV